MQDSIQLSLLNDHFDIHKVRLIFATERESVVVLAKCVQSLLAFSQCRE